MGFNGRYNYYKSPIIMGKTLGLQEIGAWTKSLSPWIFLRINCKQYKYTVLTHDKAWQGFISSLKLSPGKRSLSNSIARHRQTITVWRLLMIHQTFFF
jgi:hypothetical protein